MTKKKMSIQEQKKKTKKTYAQLAEEVRSLIGKQAVLYIPELAYALVNEGYSNKDARDRIIDDFGNDRPWADSTIYHTFPKELRDPQEKKGRTSFAVSANRREEALQEIKQGLKSIPVPRQVEPEIESEPEGQIIGWAESQKLGDSEKTTLSKMGDLRDACRQLWKALTDKEVMPHRHEDLVVDHIKPTREYRKFVYELDDVQRQDLSEWLHYLTVAIDDMQEILEKAK